MAFGVLTHWAAGGPGFKCRAGSVPRSCPEAPGTPCPTMPEGQVPRPPEQQLEPVLPALPLSGPLSLPRGCGSAGRGYFF